MQNASGLKQYVFIFLAGLFLNSPLAHSLAIDLQPASIIAGSGDSVSFDVNISGLGDFGPDSLGAFDVTVGFDPGSLSFTSYTLGDFLGLEGFGEALDISFGDLGGAVNIAQISFLFDFELDALQPGSFTLATLNFTVDSLGAGQSTVLSIFQDAILSDAYGDPLVPTSFGTALIEGRTNVPLPGTVPLFAIAALGLWLSRRSQFSRHRAS